jgi:hypothetical protein
LLSQDHPQAFRDQVIAILHCYLEEKASILSLVLGNSIAGQLFSTSVHMDFLSQLFEEEFFRYRKSLSLSDSALCRLLVVVLLQQLAVSFASA